jgi:thiamine pyrophosphate-dependent acetolactate synthase large subunit-like protein
MRFIFELTIFMTENNVALYVLKALKQEGIEHIFLVPGSSIDPFVEHCPNNLTSSPP